MIILRDIDIKFGDLDINDLNSDIIKLHKNMLKTFIYSLYFIQRLKKLNIKST